VTGPLGNSLRGEKKKKKLGVHWAAWGWGGKVERSKKVGKVGGTMLSEGDRPGDLITQKKKTRSKG